ncbi:Pleckstrin homology domain-containing family M member 1 [Taenia solium]|eukprot:TsM_000659100 transcript=TsM_000659100 gene=TsM_000659100
MDDFFLGSNALASGGSAHWLCVDCPVVNARLTHHEREPTAEDQEDQSNNDGDFLFENNWEILGDELNISVPDEHLRLLACAFPGVKVFPQGTSVYGGGCALCLSHLSPGQEAVIPRDIIECWDFTPKPGWPAFPTLPPVFAVGPSKMSSIAVSFATKKFLDSISPHPLIDIGLINPSLFACVPKLLSLRLLRRTLSLLWSLVSRCSKATSRSLVLALKHRSYMLDNLDTIDRYSLQDLQDVRNGDLEELIQTAVNQMALAHVTSCSGCRAWISFCDICRDVSRPIWPYNFTQFRRCATPDCRRVMHLDCLRLKDEKGTSVTEPSHTVNRLADGGPESADNPSSGNEDNPSNDLLPTIERIEFLPYCIVCANNLRFSKVDYSPMT